MAFNGSEGEFISIEEAGQMTKEWRENGCGPANAVFFGRERLQAILDQGDCMGIRMYFAINEDNEKTLVLVGADADENDQMHGKILDRAIPCPTNCGSSNGINS